MGDRLRFWINRIGEKLWIKPLLTCVLSTIIVFVAKLADDSQLTKFVPEITPDSIENLLSIVAASMLVIATFAVGSMVSAYASAGNNATPRAFPLIISDDLSQNALSSFIGTFIYSIIALMALKNNYFDKAGRFTLFVLSLMVLALVIVTFLRWVNRIARLGRLGGTIDKVETATAKALILRRSAPRLHGAFVRQEMNNGLAVYGEKIGYIQRIDIPVLQAVAERLQLKITVTALPGTFSAPGQPLAYVSAEAGDLPAPDQNEICKAFVIGADRTFDEDPRFGLIVLSEIASRVLSPAVNDPGSAICIIGRFVRLFALWSEPVKYTGGENCAYDRVAVPELSLDDMFDDAFTSIARDGAGTIEVVVRLQKAFQALASINDPAIQKAAVKHARLANARAELALKLPEDLSAARKAHEVVNSSF